MKSKVNRIAQVFEQQIRKAIDAAYAARKMAERYETVVSEVDRQYEIGGA